MKFGSRKKFAVNYTAFQKTLFLQFDFKIIKDNRKCRMLFICYLKVVVYLLFIFSENCLKLLHFRRSSIADKWLNSAVYRDLKKFRKSAKRGSNPVTQIQY
jgi:hypothetical protein